MRIFHKKVYFCVIGHGRNFRSTIEHLEAANETLARQLAAAKPAAEEVHSEASVAEVATLQQRVGRMIFLQSGTIDHCC